MRTTPVYRYEELASFITRLVDNGTLLPGSRVPSLREISERQRTSLSTALQAYRALEDRGVLEARPQSGFYVTARAPISLAAPAMSKPPATATDITVASVVSALLEYANDPRLVPLGYASPSPQLLAAGGLDRFLARVARTKGVAYNTYTVTRGDLRLRREIARRALRVGQALSPENIVITCGCTEALTLALKAVAQPGDTIAVESPTYFGLLAVLESLRMKALELPTDSETGVDLVALERALAAKAITACLFSSSFNNPLGCTMPEEKKEAIAELLARHRVPLIEDDIFGDIYFGAERPKPFSALDRYGAAHEAHSRNEVGVDAVRPGVAAGRAGGVPRHGRLRQPPAPGTSDVPRERRSDGEGRRSEFPPRDQDQPARRRVRAVGRTAEAAGEPSATR